MIKQRKHKALENVTKTFERDIQEFLDEIQECFDAESIPVDIEWDARGIAKIVLVPNFGEARLIAEVLLVNSLEGRGPVGSVYVKNHLEGTVEAVGSYYDALPDGRVILRELDMAEIGDLANESRRHARSRRRRI